MELAVPRGLQRFRARLACGVDQVLFPVASDQVGREVGIQDFLDRCGVLDVLPELGKNFLIGLGDPLFGEILSIDEREEWLLLQIWMLGFPLAGSGRHDAVPSCRTVAGCWIGEGHCVIGCPKGEQIGPSKADDGIEVLKPVIAIRFST